MYIIILAAGGADEGIVMSMAVRTMIRLPPYIVGFMISALCSLYRLVCLPLGPRLYIARACELQTSRPRRAEILLSAAFIPLTGGSRIFPGKKLGAAAAAS